MNSRAFIIALLGALALPAQPAGAGASFCSRAPGDPRPLPAMPARLSACAGEVKVAAASACAGAQPLLGETPWRMDSANDPLRHKECPSITVSCLDPDQNRALVVCAGGEASTPYWVATEDLSCDQKNVTTYVPLGFPQPKASNEVCPAPGAELVNQNQLVDAQVPAKELQSCLVEIAVQHAEKFHSDIQDHDQLALLQAYGAMSGQQVAAAMALAEKQIVARLKRATDLYGAQCDKPPAIPKSKTTKLLSTDLTQGQRTCELYLGAKGELAKIQMSMEPEEYKAKVIELAQLDHSTTEMSNEQLMWRTILFEGLSPQPALSKQRNSREWARLEDALGRKPQGEFIELHNGYAFGGKRMDRNAGATDCSEFVSEVYGLSAWVEDKVTKKKTKVVPSTADLMPIARFVAGEGPPLPKDSPWKGLVSCFRPVHVRKGEWPQPADLVVQRMGGEGHVVIVKDFNPSEDASSVATIEAGGGKLNRVGTSRRPLLEPGCPNAKPDEQRAVRSDIVVIRFVKGPGCTATPPVEECHQGPPLLAQLDAPKKKK
ncbi:MAG: hypothetical protein HY075_02760 [Deltaproteobacteria bacterium]|nr:hypothetical protein [Deltaproteobacteria bacterium]